MTPIANQNTESNANLTCLRCQYTWTRRNFNKLPKVCPSCNSRVWQKPLDPYWKAVRKDQAAAKEIASRYYDDDPLPPAEQAYLNRVKKQFMFEDTLRVYFAWDAELLLPVKDMCTYWLPEKMDPKPKANEIYQLNNIIATTKLISLETLKALIITNTLSHNKVLWITPVRTKPWHKYTQVVYTFNADGNEGESWFFAWPYDIAECEMAWKDWR